MAWPDPDPSIEHEPFLRREQFAEDPSEARAARNLAAEARRRGGDDPLEQSIWEEPSLMLDATALPNQLPPTYAQWLEQQVRATSTRRTWVISGLVMLAAGPWAICGALLQGLGTSMWGPLSIVLFGPVVEEVMKVALPLVIVEKRPYLFRFAGQILVCSVAGGLAFAALENVLYLFVYIPDAPPSLVAVRWSVCVLVHVVCSSLAGIGIVRVWSQTLARRVRPQLGSAMAWLGAAIAVHGVYNGVVSTLELFGR
jgi:hypothetical protein